MSRISKMLTPVLRAVGRLLSPHLSKGLGSNRPPTNPDWRLANPPARREFNLTNSKDREGKAHLPSEKPYRILCLDGGGVRGILTVRILQRIVEKHPTFLTHNVDAIVGTSVGGILSLLLSSNYTPNECEKVYDFAMPYIFPYNPWRVINPFRAKYSDKLKEEILRHYFGDRRMCDLEKTCTVVAFRLDGRRSDTHRAFFDKEGWRPAIFSNMASGPSKVLPDSDLPAWEAAMATSAAPTFFPVFKGYTDGGIVANNPSIVAISKAIAHLPHVNTRNTVLLSLGAGTFPRHTNIFSAATREGEVVIGKRGNKKIQRADWGIKQWIPFLLDLLLDGDSVTTEMVMHYLLGSGLYHRFDPVLPRQVPLDDISSMEELKDFGDSLDLQPTLQFIEKNFMADFHAADTDGYNTLESATQYQEAWNIAASKMGSQKESQSS